MGPVSTKGTAGDDTAIRVGQTTTDSADDFGGQIYNPNGTPVTNAETNSGQYYANLEQYAGEQAASDGNFVSNVITPAARVAAGVGLMGAVAIAPELAPVLGGGIAGAAAAGAIGGAASSTLADKISGAPVTLGGVGKGALTGAVTAGLGAAAPQASNALTSAGVPAPLSAGIVKGVTGAGLGALSSGLSGGNATNSAISGGVSGFLSGAVGNATGSSLLGKVAAGAGGSVLSPLLASGTSTSSVGAPNSSGSGSTPQGNIGMALSANSGLSPATTGLGTVSPSTDSTLASTIGSALPGVVQSGIGAAGSLAAANAQVGADQSAITTQQGALGNINNIWATQQQTGQGANTALQSSLGLNGATADPSNFLNMPGYQFAVQQGTQAVQRQAASMGSAYTPNTAAAVGQYVTGTASQDYNTYISQLMGAAGLGTTANQGLQTGQQTTANNISTLQQNQGQATAAGISGVTNSAAGLFGVGTSLLNGVTGGSAGVPNPNASGTVPTGSTGLGGSIPTAANGGQLQYDANGNIIGSSVPTNSSPYPASMTDTGTSDWTDPNNTSALTDPSSIFGNLYCDRRMKEAPARLGTASNGLPLYEFNYIEDETKERHVGYMADEVLEMYPDAVTVGPRGFLMVNYGKVPS
jgi:hypothetical protein